MKVYSLVLLAICLATSSTPAQQSIILSGYTTRLWQKLMRHASIDMTTKYGRNSMLNVTRPANAQIVERVMKKEAEKSEREQV